MKSMLPRLPVLLQYLAVTPLGPIGSRGSSFVYSCLRRWEFPESMQEILTRLVLRGVIPLIPARSALRVVDIPCAGLSRQAEPIVG